MPRFWKILLNHILNPDERYGFVADNPFRVDREGGSVAEGGDLATLVPLYDRRECSSGELARENILFKALVALPYDMPKRLGNLFRLSNYRVRAAGISEIRTTHFHGREDEQYQ
ncbi:hypothetical protein GQ600_1739 [Phytophthora cactorum]|nr:hypothetical protein GQ600_1739 [Phytophthora cactorum]